MWPITRSQRSVTTLTFAGTETYVPHITMVCESLKTHTTQASFLLYIPSVAVLTYSQATFQKCLDLEEVSMHSSDDQDHHVHVYFKHPECKFIQKIYLTMHPPEHQCWDLQKSQSLLTSKVCDL